MTLKKHPLHHRIDKCRPRRSDPPAYNPLLFSKDINSLFSRVRQNTTTTTIPLWQRIYSKQSDKLKCAVVLDISLRKEITTRACSELVSVGLRKFYLTLFLIVFFLFI